MNKYIVKLRCNLTNDIKHYFEKRDVVIVFIDSVLPDTLIVQSNLSIDEINKLQYVYEAKVPRIGRIDSYYKKLNTH